MSGDAQSRERLALAVEFLAAAELTSADLYERLLATKNTAQYDTARSAPARPRARCAVVAG